MWTLFIDRAWGQVGAGALAVLIAPSGLKSKYAVRLEFKATNNIADTKDSSSGSTKQSFRGKDLTHQNRLPGSGGAS